jgi:hypothetical protein
VTAALMRTGAPLNCLEKAFENYSRALELVRRGRRRMARAGRPTERSRDRLVDELRVVLERHRRTSRAKMLEILARHGLERDDDPGAALREVVRIVFKAVREPLPIDLAKITRRVGGRNPARSK